MSTGRVVHCGDYMTIDVAGLADDVRASIRTHMRVMNEMTADDWTQLSAIADMQAKCDWLDERADA
ncbi:hypothetical protein [Aeromicrobium stalagmiti]|uniref:hypothetical protein n=1 Tax=Aeromicrobium stalagmiti TaxID=2738988 RepID=UPI001567E2AF|nr:hypothetical protein [Aeromicrobium stalagmiti]NRQ51571.1 hypothetical protein [Aeromicrobium stalagmiti]